MFAVQSTHSGSIWNSWNHKYGHVCVCVCVCEHGNSSICLTCVCVWTRQFQHLPRMCVCVNTAIPASVSHVCVCVCEHGNSSMWTRPFQHLSHKTHSYIHTCTLNTWFHTRRHFKKTTSACMLHSGIHTHTHVHNSFICRNRFPRLKWRGTRFPRNFALRGPPLHVPMCVLFIHIDVDMCKHMRVCQFLVQLHSSEKACCRTCPCACPIYACTMHAYTYKYT